MSKRKREHIARPENLIDEDFFRKIEFTWVGHKALLDVHNQGYCACCWASAATGAIAVIHSLKTQKKAFPLSKQQLIDCMFKHYPNPTIEARNKKGECFPFSTGMAYRFAKEQGIYEEKNYPFIMARSECKCPSNAKVVKIDSAILLDHEKMSKHEIEQCIKTQPLTCTIPFYTSLRQHRGQETYVPTAAEIVKRQELIDKGETPIAHALLIVGFGEEKGEPIYLVQNSWGKHWGYKGYAKVKRSLVYCLAYPYIDD